MEKNEWNTQDSNVENDENSPRNLLLGLIDIIVSVFGVTVQSITRIFSATYSTRILILKLIWTIISSKEFYSLTSSKILPSLWEKLAFLSVSFIGILEGKNLADNTLILSEDNFDSDREVFTVLINFTNKMCSILG